MHILIFIFLLFPNVAVFGAPILCKTVQKFAYVESTAEERVEFDETDGAYTFADEPPMDGENNNPDVIEFSDGQGIKTPKEEFCFLVHGTNFGVYKDNTDNVVWQYAMDQVAKVRFERTNLQSVVKFYSNNVEDNELRYIVKTNGQSWSFFLTDDGVFTFDLDGENVIYFTECMLVKQIAPVTDWTISHQGLVAPQDAAVEAENVIIGAGTGFRSKDLKYCLYRQGAGLQFFDGRTQKRKLIAALDQAQNVQIQRTEQNNLAIRIGDATIQLVTGDDRKELSMGEGSLAIRDHDNPTNLRLHVSDFLLEKAFRTAIPNTAVTPTKITITGYPVSLKMTTKEGGLFSATGDFALTIVNDSIGFWQVEPTSQRKLLTPNLYVENAELKIERQSAEASFFIILTGGGQELSRTEIPAENMEGAAIEVTLAVDTVNGVKVPKLSLKGDGAANENVFLYGKENFDNITNIGSNTRCQKLLNPIEKKHGKDTLPDKNTFVEVQASGNMEIKESVENVLFSSDKNYCMIRNVQKGIIGVYETATDNTVWEIKGKKLGMSLEITGSQVVLYKRTKSRKWAIFKKTSRTYKARLSLNTDGMLTVEAETSFLVSLQAIQNGQKTEPTELKCKSDKVRHFESSFSFDGDISKTIIAQSGLLNNVEGLLSPNKSVCLVIEQDTVGVYNDVIGKFIWNIPNVYLAMFNFTHTGEEFSGVLSYRLGNAHSGLTRKTIFNLPAQPGNTVKLTDHGDLKVSVNDKVYLYGQVIASAGPEIPKVYESKSMCHNIETLTQADRFNVEMHNHIAEMNVPAGRNDSAHFYIPLPTNANEQKRGLKSANGTVCLFMDENKLSMFDDERGKMVAQTAAKNKPFKFEIKTEKLFFMHGETVHKIVAWPHKGKIRVTFDRASQLTFSAPEQTLVIDLAEDLKYTIVDQTGTFAGNLLMRQNQIIVSADLKCALVNTGFSLEVWNKGVPKDSMEIKQRNDRSSTDQAVILNANRLIVKNEGTVLKVITQLGSTRVTFDDNCNLIGHAN